MDDNSERKKTGLTGLLERGNQLLTRDSGGSSSEDGLLMDRRTYLAAAGLTTAGIAGCTGLDGGGTVQPVSAFGYGGGQTLQQTSSMTVSESEPNDRQGSADAISPGATVTGTLSVNDSDWYVADLSAGSDIAVEFSREAATGVTAVILYNPDGEFSNLRYVSTDDQVSMAQTVETSGTYFLQIVDTQNSDGGYTLSVSDGTTTPTETETATPVVTDTATPTETETTTSTPERTETATPVVTDTATPTGTATEDDYGEQGYGDYGYGGIAT
ncbi:hypothetical protein [Haloarcula sediminis]|uniref:hypothetical protein n=1 Tax=Haloarcula sediminis TaxID=3111777 RepID=UPI002D796C24|nr:hypothetical protein [Haloarcula sp. CK38]